jgi:hypothetical protein
MSIREFIEFIASHFTLEDVLYIIGREPEWLLYKIKEDLIEHREDFVVGEEDYMEVNDYD